MSPEILMLEDQAAITIATDVYGFALILWQLFTRREPYAGLQDAVVALHVVMSALRPPIPAGMPPFWEQLMARGWAQTPAVRPEFSDIFVSLEALVDYGGLTDEWLAAIRQYDG